MFEIYTSQIFKGGGGFKGEGKLDITIGSAKEGKIFAPTWEMVMEHKEAMKKAESLIDPEEKTKAKRKANREYTYAYRDMMRKSYKKHKKTWEDILRGIIPGLDGEHGRVVLCCYCRPEQFCHRKILAQMFVKLGEEINLPAVYLGEIQR